MSQPLAVYDAPFTISPGQLLAKAVILANISMLKLPLRRMVVASGIETFPVDPSKAMAVLGSPLSAPAAPSVTPPEATPVWPLPELSATDVPLVSPSRQ